VVGVCVSGPPEQLAPAGLAISRELAHVAGDAAPEPEDVHLVDGRGPGHGVASAAGTAAAAKALRSAGLVLDPVYTAKALAALPAVVGTGPAVFWHTGGVLDAVAELLTEELR
jgi:1-aminocyclopropane-1-carboxylate deaminase/D-cysteine desulfhydrase-like pyridoxal-dependent ACC family enzyme